MDAFTHQSPTGPSLAGPDLLGVGGGACPGGEGVPGGDGRGPGR